MLPGADAPYAAISARYAATPSAGDTPATPPYLHLKPLLLTPYISSSYVYANR